MCTRSPFDPRRRSQQVPCPYDDVFNMVEELDTSRNTVDASSSSRAGASRPRRAGKSTRKALRLVKAFEPLADQVTPTL